ncbi:MAG: metalloprotease PmbA [Legionellales bacterium RIFCSPHIGHO2_12_FULL_35_11]|nr:MAG: metalloprotease PmbA [Legionellales bacterium RIFCSPHIGHO2_12_FULL_35_11]
MNALSKNINTSALKSTTELKEIMNNVLKLAKEKGATDASVAVNLDAGFSVDIRIGSVETVAFSEDQGVGVNVYIGNSKGSASSSDTSIAALENMVQAAYDIASVSAPDICFGLPDMELLSNSFPDLDLYHPWNISPEEAINRAIACEKTALSLDKRITNSDGAQISNYNFITGHANSYGFMGFIQSSRHSVSCSLIAEDKKGKQRDYEYTTARDPKNLMNLDELAKSAVKRTTSRLDSKKIKTQKIPVIFSSRVCSSIFSSFISAISGGNLYQKNSFLLNSKGQEIFPKFIQIYEKPHLLGALGSAPFDAECVPTRENKFVVDGVIEQYVLNTYSARKMGLKTTANCGGVFNLTVDETASDLNSLLKIMGRGLLVTELMGQGVNILTGDYSKGATGFWVENGEIQFPVEEITIAGNLNNMFKQIVAIGNDINPNIATNCGSVLISEMTVAGN